MNLNYIDSFDVNNAVVEVVYWEQVESAELDEMWSFVQNKGNQRWLWLAIDHETKAILAYAFGQRKDTVFRQFQALLQPFGISRFYTDDWGSYERNIEAEKHIVGKKNTQRIERKNLRSCVQQSRLVI